MFTPTIYAFRSRVFIRNGCARWQGVIIPDTRPTTTQGRADESYHGSPLSSRRRGDRRIGVACAPRPSHGSCVLPRSYPFHARRPPRYDTPRAKASENGREISRALDHGAPAGPRKITARVTIHPIPNDVADRDQLKHSDSYYLIVYMDPSLVDRIMRDSQGSGRS